MKKFAFLIIVTALMATSSQAFGQKLSGGNDGYVQLPAIQMAREKARDAFYASLDAHSKAQNEANFCRSMQPYHPNAAMAAAYWQASADFQYQALVKTYYVWRGLESRGYILPIDRQLASEAESHAWNAGMYALAGASMTTSNISAHPAVVAAINAYQEIDVLFVELLV